MSGAVIFASCSNTSDRSTTASDNRAAESEEQRFVSRIFTPPGGFTTGIEGPACDVAGNLYITRHGKGTIAKVSPAGELQREIQLAGRNPSNLAFGGPDGRTIYVTVADTANVEVFRVDQPGRSRRLFERWGI
jgi:sugar lactone lactonase YvrE